MNIGVSASICVVIYVTSCTRPTVTDSLHISRLALSLVCNAMDVMFNVGTLHPVAKFANRNITCLVQDPQIWSIVFLFICFKLHPFLIYNQKCLKPSLLLVHYIFVSQLPWRHAFFFLKTLADQISSNKLFSGLIYCFRRHQAIVSIDRTPCTRYIKPNVINRKQADSVKLEKGNNCLLLFLNTSQVNVLEFYSFL